MQSLGRQLCSQNVSQLRTCVSQSRGQIVLARARISTCRQLFTRDVTHTSETIVPHVVPVTSSLPTTTGLPSHDDNLTWTERQPHRSAVLPLPTSCPGCGALSQESESTAPGYYSRTRKHVRAWLKSIRERTRKDEEIDGVDRSDPTTNTTAAAQDVESQESVRLPFCDRCHDLVHSGKGVSIEHPSIEDIADSIAESPHKHNHVYHVLDAADFPMSLIPSFHSALSLAKPRSQNRRSQHDYSVRPTMSFLITRSDLLAPTKEKVDSLMPYFRSLLRKQLGSTRESMRLGNVHLVSAKRGWWTKEIKDDIWHRGGGNWMVGKFNVGKSNLFEVIFPKGSHERAPVYSQLAKAQSKRDLADDMPQLLPEGQLLPPPQPEVPFPVLPLVSSLPGTTASPIRLSFGNKKGELIDMPGLDRGNLDRYVAAENKLDLVMENRPKVKQHNIKPGQSLLLGGGVIRMTPLLNGGNSKTVMLAYPFVPLEAHVTATEKAIGTQQQVRESGITSILASDVGSDFRSAGVITLETDVTKQHAGSLLRSGVDVSKLPFRVYGADVLIQGVGWVEVTCQVRRRVSLEHAIPTEAEDRVETPSATDSLNMASFAASLNPQSSDEAPVPSNLDVLTEDFKPYTPQLTADFQLPQIEVFTPNGEHISSRPPMNAWMLWKEGTIQKTRSKGMRPRKPMKGAKKQAKKG